MIGCEILVISPIPLSSNFREYLKTKSREYGPENAKVFRPIYPDLPYTKIFLPIDRMVGLFNLFSFDFLTTRAFKSINFLPDIVYSHFLFRSGPAALNIANRLKVPCVVALGESNLRKHTNYFHLKRLSNTLNRFDGIISVSNVNRRFCVDNLLIRRDRIEVIPNGVDRKTFFPRDKMLMRRKFGFPLDSHIVAFLGSFSYRKGPLRVLEAIKLVGRDLKCIFIGSGSPKYTPFGDEVLFCDKVPHGLVPELLCASDVFVLPTLDEGSCNAIFEAMACGLPIISSNIASIKEQVEPDFSILVDPLAIASLAGAIAQIVFDPRIRDRMSSSAINHSIKFDLHDRATTIASYLGKIRAKV